MCPLLVSNAKQSECGVVLVRVRQVPRYLFFAGGRAGSDLG